MDWLQATAGDLGRGIGAGRIDPVELTEAHLEAIAAHPLAGRIYARTTPERARAEAAAAGERARKGFRRGLLDGVPISWKDLYDTAGVATESGSRLLAGRVPERDALVLQNAVNAGLVCLGKTHQTELAFSGLGPNPMTASAPNRHDPGKSTGGSSSGAASSVGYGLAVAGIGSDTGGSVRIPAAWNDLVGLKTTWGLLSLEGVVPLCEKLDTVGPLTRSVEDAALLLGALGGTAAPDLAGAELAGRRLAVLEGALEGLAGPVASAFDAAVARLEAAGATVGRIGVGFLPEIAGMAGVLYSTEAYAIWGETIEAAPEKMFPPTLERFRMGAKVPAIDYIRAWRRAEAMRREWAALTAGYDAVILPTVPSLPSSIAEAEADAKVFVARNVEALRNTRIANVLGLCALTLPTGTPSAGLMLMAAPFTEAALLRLGQAAERALA